MSSEKTLILSLKDVSVCGLIDPHHIILQDINLDVYEGDVISIIGRCGSGKSVLLRTLVGLIQTSQGALKHRGQTFTGITPNTSMVFHEATLMPWLTVIENVALALESKNLPQAEVQERSFAMISRLGLEGYENAYPKELSGAMLQKICIARAFVINPDLVVLDDAFSALDILHIDSIWEDLFALIALKGAIVFVTHNIEEAVLHANKIVVLDGNPSDNDHPGKICGVTAVNLPYPRNFKSKEVVKIIDNMYFMIAHHGSQDFSDQDLTPRNAAPLMLPDVEVSSMIGLLIALEELQTNNEPIDLPLLADHVKLEVDDLFPIIEALILLDFSLITQGDIVMTRLGRQFLKSGTDQRQEIFGQAMKVNIPFTNVLINALENTAVQSHALPLEYFATMIPSKLGLEKRYHFLKIFISWCRYSDILEYDSDSNLVFLTPSL